MAIGMEERMVGFAADEIDPWASTRDARLKWVVIVDEALDAGRAVNAAVCVAAATQGRVAGVIGPDGVDADGGRHPGLPWAGCSILGAPAEALASIRVKAAGREDVFVADMPEEAQATRVYGEYLDRVAAKGSGELQYLAVSVVGPRRAVDRIVGRLPLYGSSPRPATVDARPLDRSGD